MKPNFSQLDNGLRVITQRTNFNSSISLGIWLSKGSRHETQQEGGLFHFIEHTLFKGTPRFKAKQIAEIFDGMGGHLDAHTGKEETCFSFRLRDKHAEKGLDVLGDMLCNPLFDERELEKERQVILEEIAMAADDPEDLIFEACQQKFWPNHSLGRPILGTAALVQNYQSETVRDFFQSYYQPSQLIVAAAGKCDHETLCEQLQQIFSNQNPFGNSRQYEPPPLPQSFIHTIHKPHLEQVSFCLLFPGCSQTDPRKAALSLLSTVLGGGMSSRLFQVIREQHGLTYHVGSFAQAYEDTGYLCIYGSCAPGNLDRVLALIAQECDRLKQEPVTAEELDRCVEQCSGNYVLNLEHTAAIATSLAKTLRYEGRLWNQEQIINRWTQVSPTQIQEIAQQILGAEQCGLGVAGPIKGRRVRFPLSCSS